MRILLVGQHYGHIYTALIKRAHGVDWVLEVERINKERIRGPVRVGSRGTETLDLPLGDFDAALLGDLVDSKKVPADTVMWQLKEANIPTCGICATEKANTRLTARGAQLACPRFCVMRSLDRLILDLRRRRN
jgi:hypothetical protein